MFSFSLLPLFDCFFCSSVLGSEWVGVANVETHLWLNSSACQMVGSPVSGSPSCSGYLSFQIILPALCEKDLIVLVWGNKTVNDRTRLLFNLSQNLTSAMVTPLTQLTLTQGSLCLVQSCRWDFLPIKNHLLVVEVDASDTGLALSCPGATLYKGLKMTSLCLLLSPAHSSKEKLWQW